MTRLESFSAGLLGLDKEAKAAWARMAADGRLSLSSMRRLYKMAKSTRGNLTPRAFMTAMRSYRTPEKVWAHGAAEMAAKFLPSGSSPGDPYMHSQFMRMAREGGLGADGVRRLKKTFSQPARSKADIAGVGMNSAGRPRRLQAEATGDVPSTIWGSAKSRGAQYIPQTNQITRTGDVLVDRHELGHWLSAVKMTNSPNKAKREMEALYSKLYRTADPGTRQLLDETTRRPHGFGDPNMLGEAYGHWLATRRGLIGARLRKATAADWSSRWADRARTTGGPGNDALASTVEHLQRNYALMPTP